MDQHIIAGVHIVDRESHAPLVQSVLTKYGSQIHTRLGLHDSINPSNGLLVLEIADTEDSMNLIKDLEAIDGVECQTMLFAH